MDMIINDIIQRSAHNLQYATKKEENFKVLLIFLTFVNHLTYGFIIWILLEGRGSLMFSSKKISRVIAPGRAIGKNVNGI